MIRIKQDDKDDRLILAGIFCIAFLFVFSSTYNPFNMRRMHIDSSNYITIAQGITRGELPYRDFVDNKGPLTYLISVPGLALGGFTGVWLTELLLACISVLFAYKTALFFTGKRRALFAAACTFIEALVFFSVNAGTEEYSLPFLMVSFYIFTKYFFSEQKDISFFELIALGFCCACAVSIKLNMFPLWLGFCAVVFIETLRTGRFAALGKYILGFSLGLLIVAVPVFFYLKLNGIFSDFIAQVVAGGAARGFGGGGLKQLAKTFYATLYRSYCIVPLVAGVFWSISAYKKPFFPFAAGYTLSYILSVLFLSFSPGSPFYNIILVPFFVPPIASLFEFAKRSFSALKYKNLAFILFFCVLLSEEILKYVDDAFENFHDNSGKELIAAGKMIDENTAPDDKIISLGCGGYIYLFTERRAASKYFYQGSGVDLIPGSRETFLSDVLNTKPAIIAIYTAGENGRYDYLPAWYKPVFDMIERDYTPLSGQNGYALFKRK
ncbi:MAG: glycosyltransferase family 39 protein [Spirochaetaceae bacterium]|jgi:hypothetical protein|nr:glycosyltransferase family 39 protein [Spirochaetaceae bacterium]